MIAVLLTPYTGDGLTEETAYRPVLADVMPGVAWNDTTERSTENGLPFPNLLVVEAVMSAAEISEIGSDDRFFVLKPGTDIPGLALLEWLELNGASGHGVVESDGQATAISKLREYCRAL